MEKTLILFIREKQKDQDKDKDKDITVQYTGTVVSITTKNKITPDSKILSKINLEDCVKVYNTCKDCVKHKPNDKQILYSFDRLEIIDRAISIYHEKEFTEGLILQDSYSNINNKNKQWLIEPILKT